MILDKIINICKKRNIKIVEDASESLGNFFLVGRYKGKHTGTIGDVGCLSFNGNKIITAGGGGMILTNNKKIYEKALYLTTQAKDDGELFIHNDIGYNYRLSNIHAALGIAQLENINKVIYKKKIIYNFYRNKLNNRDNLDFFLVSEVASSNYWLNIVSLKQNFNDNKMKKLIKKFAKNNIEVRPIWKPNHLQKEYRQCQKYLISNAIKITNSSLCLPSDLKLDENDIDKVINLL
jgi:perosamine synthetase